MLEGAGAALLLAPALIWTEVSSTHLDPYHRLLPMTTVARGLALELVALTLLATVALRGLARIGARSAAVSARDPLLLAWALWFGLLAARTAAGLILVQVVRWQQFTPARAFLLVAGGLALLWLAQPLWYSGAIKGARFAILLLGFSIFWVLPILARAGLAHQARDEAAFRKPLPAATGPHRRIVWLLFDELSYDQVFGHRWPGLELPNLDRLHAESVSFSNMQPDGYFTELVIPSLFLGKPVEEIRGTSSGWMLYRTEERAPSQRFDGSQTLFADAEREGWTTGAMGEFNPYCRVLRDQLDSCWMNLPPLPDHFSRDQGTFHNAIAPVAANWTRMKRHGEQAAAATGLSPIDEMGTVRAAIAMIDDAGIDLCFVHMPMPHPPGAYNRKTGKVTSGGSYIDNLALTDRALGALLQVVAQTPSAGETTVVVSSDHSWRVPYWRHAFGWTHEDEVASGHGHFDPRPFLLVRFPGEDAAAAVSRPVPLLAMHDMIERMIAGQLADPQQLSTWAAQQYVSAAAERTGAHSAAAAGR